ncbi:MAG TPA: [protein-PII] uridylyltransferase [Acidimicrobiales bacterium]|nr:[protein-PII] uridylyltransferase [Acidimicrobiales bacterium]
MPLDLRLLAGAPYAAAGCTSVTDAPRRFQHDSWLGSLLGTEEGVSLLAVGSYGRGDAAPFSDLDLLLIHNGKRKPPAIKKLADRIWYPIWDRGVGLDHSVRTVKEALAVADSDLKAMLGMLDARYIAGDRRLADELASRAREQWRGKGKRWLRVLHDAVVERHSRFGDVAYLLEPELKEGRGGLRDVHALFAARLATPVLAERIEAVAEPHDRIAEVRSALHARVGKALDRLVLQEQDGVAADLAYTDADALMGALSAAARTISYVSDDAWDRIDAWLGGPRARAERVIVAHDPGHWLSAAVEAAETGVPLSPSALAAVAVDAVEPPAIWPEAWRHDLVALLGAGHNAIPVLEALDQHGLMVKLIPEWASVRFKPQRNAYHRFTVDRHLWEAAANAAARTRTVRRPDLLLLGALLHDIGKGFPGDHTDAGIDVVGRIGPRLGLVDGDVKVLQELVRLHLLLPDVATRRDLSDPATIDHVAREVGDVDTLELLAALTEADSLATGSSAWSDWKAGLVAELVDRTRRVLQGSELVAEPAPLEVPEGLVEGLHGEGHRCTVVAPDRPGLFSKVAGVLALHGLDVRSASAGLAGDGRAVEVFDVEPSFGKEPRWDRVAADLQAVFDGRLSLADKLIERSRSYARRYRRTAARPADPRVLFDNEASDRATIIEVRAPDGIAVLHRITTGLANCGLDVRVARVSTMGHEVVDAFYVTDRAGAKVFDDEALAAIESAVLRNLKD